MITYINPVIAVGLGVAVLGEQPGAGAVAGLLPSGRRKPDTATAKPVKMGL